MYAKSISPGSKIERYSPHVEGYSPNRSPHMKRFLKPYFQYDTISNTSALTLFLTKYEFSII